MLYIHVRSPKKTTAVKSRLRRFASCVGYFRSRELRVECWSTGVCVLPPGMPSVQLQPEFPRFSLTSFPNRVCDLDYSIGGGVSTHPCDDGKHTIHMLPKCITWVELCFFFLQDILYVRYVECWSALLCVFLFLTYITVFRLQFRVSMFLPPWFPQ